MAVFTALSRAEVNAFLSQFSIGELIDLRGIHTGIENTNYFVTTDHGRYVLTVFEQLTSKQLPFYLQLMRHFARKGLPVPEPQPTRTGALLADLKSKPAALVTRLPGHATAEPSAAQCAMVGEFLARMHLAGQDFEPFAPHLRGIGWWKNVVPQLEPHVPNHVMHLLAEELILQDSFFRSARFEKLPTGPIHADLFRDNVLLVHDGEAHRIGGVIDFYFAGCSIWLFDLAVTINDWGIVHATGAFEASRAQALLDAYDTVRPLTEDEHECWRTALRAAALRFWISRLHDYYLPRPAHLLTPHDPAHFERILKRRTVDAALPWVAR